MRALSLWQPWASAMAVRRPTDPTRMLKRFETRGWQPAKEMVGERLAICAAKTQRDPETKENLRDWWMARVKRHEVYAAAFAAAGLQDWTDLPFGAVVCHGVLRRVAQTEALLMSSAVDDIENDWGNFSPGRFGWELADVVVLPRPVPIVGKQGVFWWDEKEAA